MVGMNPITRKELREKIKKDSPKMSETTLKKYSDAPFDGAYPMFVVKDNKATLDITASFGRWDIKRGNVYRRLQLEFG